MNFVRRTDSLTSEMGGALSNVHKRHVLTSTCGERSSTANCDCPRTGGQLLRLLSRNLVLIGCAKRDNAAS